jgi:hypothetical protein
VAEPCPEHLIRIDSAGQVRKVENRRLGPDWRSLSLSVGKPSIFAVLANPCPPTRRGNHNMEKVRGRLVNFRVTDDEFEQLKLACDRQGARCLSAFARKMMLNATNANGENLADKLATLDRRLSILEDSLSRLFNALTRSSVDINAS